MASRVPVSRAQIQRQIPGYGESASPAAFERMFERDKDELRSMGIPVETVTDASGEVQGYRIPQDRYALEDLDLTLEERAAVAVAAQVWGRAVMAPMAGTALRKLESTAGDPDTWSPASMRGTVQLTTSDAALLPLMGAIRQERAVRFAYRTPVESEARDRTVSPWGLRSLNGNWTMVGHDHDRGAVRTFRLSRIVGAVSVLTAARLASPPEDFDIARAGSEQGEEPAVSAVLRLAPGRGASLRGRAREESGSDRWTADVVTVDAPSIDALVPLVCGAGSDVIVLEPPELVAAVQSALDAIVDAHAVDAHAVDTHAPGGEDGS